MSRTALLGLVLVGMGAGCIAKADSAMEVEVSARFAPAASADAVAVITDDNWLKVYDAASGDLLWTRSYEEDVPLGPPLIVKQRVFVVTARDIYSRPLREEKSTVGARTGQGPTKAGTVPMTRAIGEVRGTQKDPLQCYASLGDAVVAATKGGRLMVVGGDTGKLDADETRSGDSPVAVAGDGKTVAIAQGRKINLLQRTALTKVQRSVAVSFDPEWIAISGQRLVVAGHGSVAVLDTESGDRVDRSVELADILAVGVVDGRAVAVGKTDLVAEKKGKLISHELTDSALLGQRASAAFVGEDGVLLAGGEVAKLFDADLGLVRRWKLRSGVEHAALAEGAKKLVYTLAARLIVTSPEAGSEVATVAGRKTRVELFDFQNLGASEAPELGAGNEAFVADLLAQALRKQDDLDVHRRKSETLGRNTAAEKAGALLLGGEYVVDAGGRYKIMVHLRRPDTKVEVAADVIESNSWRELQSLRDEPLGHIDQEADVLGQQCRKNGLVDALLADKGAVDRFGPRLAFVDQGHEPTFSIYTGHDGDKVNLELSAKRAAHLLVLELESTGKVRLLLPRADHEHPELAAGEKKTFADFGFKLAVGDKVGTGLERLVLLVSDDEVDVDRDLWDPQGDLDQEVKLLQSVTKQIRDAGDDSWALSVARAHLTTKRGD